MTTFEELRIEAGLSVSELARLADVSRDTVTKADNGEAIRGNIAGKLCSVLSERLNRRITYRDAGITLL